MKPGDEGFLYLLAADGDHKAVELFDRIKKFPSEAQFTTVQEGVQRIISEKSAIFLSENELRLYNKYYPIKQNIKALPGDWDGNGLTGELNEIIVPKNSPIGPILSHGFQVLYESGMMTSLEAKSVGRPIQKQSSSMNTFVLEPGHVILVFSILSCALVLSLIIFAIELITRNFFRS